MDPSENSKKEYGEKRERERFDHIKYPLRRSYSRETLNEHQDELVGELTPKELRQKRWKRRYKTKRKSQETSKTPPTPDDVVPATNGDVSVSVEASPEEETFTCLNARTALILPFLYRTEHSNPFQFRDEISQRMFPTKFGNVPLWQPFDISCKEVYDLRPHFRQVLGCKEKNAAAPERTWTAHRLTLHEAVRTELFSKATLFLVQNESETTFETEFENIELHMYPRGASLLVIHINWNPPWKTERGEYITVDDLRSLIYVARYKKKIDGVCNGWGLKFGDVGDYSQELLDQLRNTLGQDLFEAKFSGNTLSMGTLANWLVCLPNENVAAPTHRVDTPRHAIHHSTVVLNKEPSVDALNEYLFHLRRSFGQKNRPPPNSAGVLGRVLVWRRNKYIGVSREGTVSMSWPISGNDETYSFEVNYWHKKFQGLFLILALHVHGEKLVFEDLSDLAATQAENLSIDSNFEQMQRQRNRLRNLASVMTRYTVSMSSSDCGGTTEYSEFFISLREVYGIPELRDELSTELKDVLAVVESNYLEEEKNQRDLEEEQRRVKNEIIARINKEKSAHRQRFEIILSVFGSITLPFVVVGGIWGMNLSNLPDVNFWWVIFFCCLFSLTILMVLSALLMIRRWNFFKLRRGAHVRYEGYDGLEHEA